jgi:phage terminase small subunit
MPRPSRESRHFAPSVVERLAPPADLDGDARALFAGIVTSCKPEHFRPCDSVLLCAYVRAILAEREASAMLAKKGRVDKAGRPSPWLNILAQANRAMLSYARALRLSPMGRAPSTPSIATRPMKPVSVYEVLDLERATDGNGAA